MGFVQTTSFGIAFENRNKEVNMLFLPAAMVA